MSNNKKKFPVFLLIIVAGFCIISMMPILGFLSKVKMGTQEIETPEPLEIRLFDMASRYKNGEISVIEMSAITTFAWDRLYFFGNYTSSETLDKEVGESWRNLDNCLDKGRFLENSDSYTLLVFTQNNIVVHCLAHPLVPYPFDLPQRAGSPVQMYGKPGFSPKEALFVIRESGSIGLKDHK
jgi:hypothetical protein